MPPVGCLASRSNASGPMARPDPSFGNNGVATLDLPERSHISVSTLLRQPDGKILAVGSDQSYNHDASQVMIARFNPDGQVDTTFGHDGLAKAFIRPDGGGKAGINHAVLQPNGRIIVSAVAYGRYSLVLGFTSDGTLDRHYGENGRTILWRSRLRDADAYGVDLALQPDGKLVFALATVKRDITNTPRADDILVGRLTRTGRVDGTFGDHGFTLNDFGGEDGPRALFARPNGDILLVGQSFTHRNVAFLALYEGGG